MFDLNQRLIALLALALQVVGIAIILLSLAVDWNPSAKKRIMMAGTIFLWVGIFVADFVLISMIDN